MFKLFYILDGEQYTELFDTFSELEQFIDDNFIEQFRIF